MRIRASTESEGGRLNGLQFGFNLRSHATFPVRFKIDELQTSLIEHNSKKIEHYPPKKDYSSREVSISSSSIGWFDDHYILVPDNLKGHIEAKLFVKISYGRNGKLCHIIELNKKTTFHVGDSGLSGGDIWYDQ